jgi:hypothetical protein
MVDGQASCDFDVALSYAGEDRGYVAAVANDLREAGVHVFYDEFMVAISGESIFTVILTTYIGTVRDS